MKKRKLKLTLLMAFLIAAEVGCGVKKPKVTSYEECRSLCSDEIKSCISSCYTWRWSAKRTMDCVEKCNQKNEKCQQQCSELKESTAEPFIKY